MDRPYSSKARKSQGRITINSEASEKLKALFPEQSSTHMVSSFAENENRKATEQKPSVSNITKGSCDSTCVRVKSLPKIVITAADDQKSDTNLITSTPSDKKFSQPLIKAPLLSTFLQVPTRIRSASIRRPPITRPIVKVVSTTTVVRQRPFGGNERPNTVWHSGKPVVVSSSSSDSDSSLDGAETKEKQTPSGTATPESSAPSDVAREPVETSEEARTAQKSIDISTAIEESTAVSINETSKFDIKPDTPSVDTTPSRPTANNVSFHPVYVNNN